MKWNNLGVASDENIIAKTSRPYRIENRRGNSLVCF